MGLMWRISTPSSEERCKRDGTNFTWGDYAEKMFNLILMRHCKATEFFAVNDYYGSDVINPKDGDHIKGGGNYLGGHTKNIFPSIKRDFPGAKELQDFFRNPLNKIRLQAFLKDYFKTRCKDINKRFIYLERNNSEDISRDNLKKSVQRFDCSHLEADTAMLYVYSVIRTVDSATPVLLDSEDTDV